MTGQDPHSRSADVVHDHRPVEAQYVRQGRRGRRILIVLIVSVGAAAVLLLGWWAINNNSLQRTTDAASAAPPPSEVVATGSAMPAGPETAPAPIGAARP